MIILTSNTSNYSDRALITNNKDENNYNKNNNNWTPRERSRKKEVKYFERKRKQNYFNICKWNNINQIWYTYNYKTISTTTRKRQSISAECTINTAPQNTTTNQHQTYNTIHNLKSEVYSLVV